MTIRPLDRRMLTGLSRPFEPGRACAFAIACFALFAVSVLLMPAITDGYDPVRQTISEGVLAPYGYIQTGGLFLLALGSFALSASMCRRCADRRQYGTAALLASSAGFVVLLAIFPVDYGNHARSLAGRMHNFGAVSAFIAITAAMVWSSLPWRRRLAWRQALTIAVLAAMLAFAVCLTFDIGPRGLVQRLSAAVQLAWLGLLALQLRSLRTGAAAEAAAAPTPEASRGDTPRPT